VRLSLSTRRLFGLAVLATIQLAVCFASWRQGGGWLPLVGMVASAVVLVMLAARPHVPRRRRS
jgi:CHASE2 domain-containing sensor protein